MQPSRQNADDLPVFTPNTDDFHLTDGVVGGITAVFV